MELTTSGKTLRSPDAFSARKPHSVTARSDQTPACRRIDYQVTALIVVAAAIRFVVYLHNRSLWLDEAMLAGNIITRSYGGLMHRLEANQGAPVGFLWVEKFIGLHLGYREYALRMLPLLAGIGALLAFANFTKSALSRQGRLVAVALLALCPVAIYQSSELKQYGVDLLVSSLLLYLYLAVRDKRLTVATGCMSAAAGAAAVWMSHPCVFVLGAIGLVLISSAWLSKSRRDAWAWVAVSAGWLASFATLYVVSLRDLAGNEFLLRYWNEDFVPDRVLALIPWFFKHIIGLFANPAGLWEGPAVLLFALGIWSLSHRDRRLTAVFAATVLLLAAANFMRLYPIGDRLSLFLLPMLFVNIGEGVAFVRTRWRSRLAFAAALLLLVAAPAISLTQRTLRPGGWNVQEIRPVLEAVQRRSRATDTWYIYVHSAPAYSYYRLVYGIDWPKVVIGQQWRGSDGRLEELKNLRGRVWFVVTDSPWDPEMRSEHRFVDELDQLGKRVDEVQTTAWRSGDPPAGHIGAGAYLYEMRGTAPANDLAKGNGPSR